MKKQHSYSNVLHQTSYTPQNYITSFKTQYRTKQPIYWDVDDVILNSLETAISIINPSKTLSDVRDWNLKSIDSSLTPESLSSLFDSDEFWSNVTIKPDFLSILCSGILSSYTNCFVTKGSSLAAENKISILNHYFGSLFDEQNFINLPPQTPKSIVSMHKGIQVDDNFNNLLNTNAYLKILLTNNLSTEFNKGYATRTNNHDELLLTDNFYIINDLSELKQILEFNIENPI